MTKTHVIVGSIRRLSVHVAFRPLKLPFITNKKRTFTIKQPSSTYLHFKMMCVRTELKNDCACHQFARENWG